MKEKVQTAIIKCPNCSYKTEIEVPQTSCLAAFKCEGCREVITIPAGSENCCVVCEFSAVECPKPNKHNNS